MARHSKPIPTRREALARMGALTLGAAAVSYGIPGARPVMAADYPPTDGQMQGFVILKNRKPAPEAPFLDGEGEERRLSDFRGDVLLVNFWATWCPPCVHEMPSLGRLAEALSGEQFRLLAISQDRGGQAVAEPFLRERLGIQNIELYFDSKLKLGRDFGVRGLPTSLLVDRSGLVVGGLEGGAEWDGPDALALIRHVLAEGQEETGSTSSET